VEISMDCGRCPQGSRLVELVLEFRAVHAGLHGGHGVGGMIETILSSRRRSTITSPPSGIAPPSTPEPLP